MAYSRPSLCLLRVPSISRYPEVSVSSTLFFEKIGSKSEAALELSNYIVLALICGIKALSILTGSNCRKPFTICGKSSSSVVRYLIPSGFAISVVRSVHPSFIHFRFVYEDIVESVSKGSKTF